MWSRAERTRTVAINPPPARAYRVTVLHCNSTSGDSEDPSAAALLRGNELRNASHKSDSHLGGDGDTALAAGFKQVRRSH